MSACSGDQLVLSSVSASAAGKGGMTTSSSRFPVNLVLPRVREVLRRRTRCILEAPPGAGKTTRLPLALLAAADEDGWLKGKSILMLEPRRMAARRAAGYMASLLGEPVGRAVGYEVRLDRRPGTRVTLLTEGILTRRLQADPELAGVGCLIFDEFHERNLHGDLGLALALECQDALRPDLRILIMSATLESGALAPLLAGGEGVPGESACPVLRSEGRLWPVSTRYLPRADFSPTLIEPGSDALFSAGHVAAAVRRALGEASGSILVFLPGAREIRRVGDLLADLPARGVRLHVLHGDLSPADQDAAIAPVSGAERKVVLSTSIAETSLTIEGIGIVVDAGLSRTVRYDPGTGLERLVTTRVSLAGADQRRGRAGRTGPGVCYRLWNAGDEAGFPSGRKPEILEADLAALRLELAVWGARDADDLRWLDTPPRPAMQRATDLLIRLGALDKAGGATRRGRALAELPLHPRLGHMVLGAKERGLGSLACLLAALLGARDPLARERPGVDIRRRLAWLLDQRASAGRLWEAARQIGRRVGLTRLCIDDVDLEQSGLVLALAYPDRVAQRRGRGRFRMANGRGAAVTEDDPLADVPFLAIGSLAGDMGDSRVFQAAPLAVDTLKNLFASELVRRVRIGWDGAAQAVVSRTELCLGALVVEEAPLTTPDDETCRAAVCEGIRTLGLECLPWDAQMRAWRDRVRFLRCLEQGDRPNAVARSDPDGGEGGDLWPDVSDAALLHGLEEWLGPFLYGVTRRAQFKTIDLASALRALLNRDRQRGLDAEAPTHLIVPSGSRIVLDYSSCVGEGGALRPPVLAVKLQELFGLTTTPAVASGRVPVLIHLLSPAGRPLQVTQDLAGFWRNGYPAVRAEMRGRYPRHPWPEDPLAAPPTRRARAKS